MTNNSIYLLLIIFFYSKSAYSQIFHYEKIYEAVYEGDTVCIGPPNGFDCYIPPKSNSIVFADLNSDGISEGYAPNDFYPNGGPLLQYINNGTYTEPCWVIQSYDYVDIQLSNNYVLDSPSFVDISGDGFPDLVHGDFSTGGGGGGTIHYHKYNPIEYKYELVTDTLWGIDFYDYSNIACDDFDGDGDPDCIVTNGLFEVISMVNLGGGKWAKPDTIGFDATNPSLGDIDNDGFPELLLSYCNWWPCYSQDIAFYKVNVFSQDSIAWKLESNDFISGKNYTHPKFLYHNNDTLIDLLVYENKKALLLLNTGTPDSADYSQVSRFIFPFHLPNYYDKLFVEDLDGNDNNEIFGSQYLYGLDDQVYYEDFGSGFENDWHQIKNNIDSFFLSFPNPDSLYVTYQNNFSFGADFTGDDLNDLIVRVRSRPPYNDNRFMLFENTPTNQFKYLQDSTLEAIPNVVDWSEPYIVDTDNDGNWELLFKTSGLGWQHYERTPPNNQWDTFSSFNSFQNAVVSTPILGTPTFVDFDNDGKLDVLTLNGPNNLLSFYRRIGELDSLSFELQPRDNYQPTKWDAQLVGNGLTFFTNFDGHCGEDLVVKSGCRGNFAYGYRGITPEIISPNANDSFTICDSFAVLEALPIGGSWKGVVEADGTFQPSAIGVGQFEAIYSYTDPDNCYTFSDTLLLNIKDCISLTEEEKMINSSIQKIVISPNPSSNRFEIHLNQSKPNQIAISLTNILGGKNINLFDNFEVRGEAVYEFAFPSDFPAGVYLIGIRVNNEKILTQKLVRL